MAHIGFPQAKAVVQTRANVPSGRSIRPRFGFDANQLKLSAPAAATPAADSPLKPLTTPTAPAGVYPGVQQSLAVQSYMPLGTHRPLAETEEKAVEAGLRRWWPKIAPGYSTPVTELLASPGKTAFLGGSAGGFALGALGLMVSPYVALAGLAVGALVGGCTGYFSRRQANENKLDLLQRLPSGATQRDLLSDPVYQSDLNRAAASATAGSLFGNVAEMMLMNGILNGGNRVGGLGMPSRNLAWAPKSSFVRSPAPMRRSF